MADAATSSRYRPQPHIARPAATSTATPAMAPFLSAQTSPPRHAAGPKTPSPNYFDFRVDGNSYISDSPQHARNNWSNPSSAVRSAAAQSPSIVPNDQNPALDAFRRQSDTKTFNLSGLNNFKATKGSEPQPSSPKPITSPRESGRSRTTPRDLPPHRSHRSSLDPSSADLSRSPKRVLSPGSATESTRRGSPPSYSNAEPGSTQERGDASDNQPRFKLPLEHLNGSYASLKNRPAEKSPATDDENSQMMVTPQYVIDLMDSEPNDVLVLDLRLATQFSVSHLMSALSLCLPTTLLKRPSFNVKKLAETFKDDEQRRRFEGWKQKGHIVVYDNSSVLAKDASICHNTINKFRSDGYEGNLHIIKGGFNAFAAHHPSYVESDKDRAPSDAGSPDGDGPDVAPVVGGCPMPSTDKPANPFFGNIRQNMDLIGGVGRIPLTQPAKATPAAVREYPGWLREASRGGDQGEQVSGKFERIERREKKRMEEALSGQVVWNGSPRQQQQPARAVQIAGLEQGSKNRYNNIWPFEHSRVRLQGVPGHGCDYFNASHIQASGSHKRYISTQAPIPATFDDFWNVVWQQDVRVLVMLTAEREGAQVKAHNYWDRRRYGPLLLDFLSEKRASLEPARIARHRRRPAAMQRHSTNSANPTIPLATIPTNESSSSSSSAAKSGGDQPYVTVRKFTLSHERFPFEPLREITQLQYANWPDFGAPAHPAHLVGLVEQCDAVVRASSGRTRGPPDNGTSVSPVSPTSPTSAAEPEPPSPRPVLVHCSAGCGRTGTFCTVDSVIDMLKRQRRARTRGAGAGAAAMEVDGKGDGGGEKAGDDVDGPWVRRDDLDLVERTVEEFRHQRISMVQSLRQYVLCYETVMEWIVEQEGEGL